jgi:winged helix DNA-binding protein
MVRAREPSVISRDKLSLRELNRATLARQLLLERHVVSARVAIGQLAGMQAQAPLAPYVGLWSRIADFRPGELADLLAERAVVRAHLMRNTVHLVTAEDYAAFRPLLQPLMERGLAGNFGRNLVGVDRAEFKAAAAALLAERPLTRTQLARELAPRWPGHDPMSLAYAATHLLPLVQVPPRGLWRRTGPPTWFLADAWIPDWPIDPPQTPLSQLAPLSPQERREAAERLVLRYLAGYGPAGVKDIQAWSGLSRLREVTEGMLREVTEGMGPRLRGFSGPDGAQLLDLPDAPRPDVDVPAPPRFLPEYDNLLLSFADRSRVIPHGRPVPLPPGNGATGGTLLLDGLWLADWAITVKDGQAILRIRPFVPLTARDTDAIAAQGAQLLEFAAEDAEVRDVRVAAAG